MTPYPTSPALQPRNALIATVPQGAPLNQPAPPSNLPALLASTIGHAALLSDTPAKWASTVAMLKQNGVDPHGYEDFDKGRPAAMAAAGTQAPEEDSE
ncbi:MAG: hypothetical protein WA265_07030 [Rhodomicrobium sp.]